MTWHRTKVLKRFQAVSIITATYVMVSNVSAQDESDAASAAPGYEMVDPEHPARQGVLNVPGWMLLVTAVVVAAFVLFVLFSRAQKAK